MADYGVTDVGFRIKPKSVIVSDLKNNFKGAFGQDLDVSIESPEGQIIDIVSQVASDLWNVAKQAWDAFNPNATSGISLDNIVKLNNLTRDVATPTTVLVTFTGTPGTIIPLGTTVSTPALIDGTESIKFDTSTQVIIQAGGTVNVLAIAQVAGAVPITVGRISILDVAVPGVTSVTNLTGGNLGKDAESDAKFRARRQVEVALPAVSTVDAITAGIQDIDTVVSVNILENDTGSVASIEGVTLDPHQLGILVQGAETDEEKEAIADVIFRRKAPGIPLKGSVTEDVYDIQGYPHTMKWDTPTAVPIYIIINTDSVDNLLPTDGTDIKDAIVAWSSDPVEGAVIGKDVSFFRLLDPINSVDGHNVQSMFIGTSPAPTGTGDIPISGSQVALFDATNIIVTVSV